MNDDDGATVVAVLLADGWHQIVPGSFSVGPLRLAATADLGGPGFRFEETDAGRPYRPATLAGPLDSVIAVRQVARAPRSAAESDRGGQLRVMRGARQHQQRQAL
jgi:hypothetical protein